MTDPTAPRRTPAVHPRAAAQAVAAVAVLIMSAAACTASNHVGSPSKANPAAASASAAAQFGAGISSTPLGPQNVIVQNQQAVQQNPAPAQQNPAPAQTQAAAQGQGGTQGQAGTKAAVPLSGLAAATGCTVALPARGQQLKQSTCTTQQGTQYAVTTFGTAADQQAWLKATEGGTFLLGNLWAIGADSATLQSLQQTVGGSIASS